MKGFPIVLFHFGSRGGDKQHQEDQAKLLKEGRKENAISQFYQKTLSFTTVLSFLVSDG